MTLSPVRTKRVHIQFKLAHMNSPVFSTRLHFFPLLSVVAREIRVDKGKTTLNNPKGLKESCLDFKITLIRFLKFYQHTYIYI